MVVSPGIELKKIVKKEKKKREDKFLLKE